MSRIFLPSVFRSHVQSALVPRTPLSPRRQRVTCRFCGTGAGVVSVTIPYVLRYLASELAAMNIKPVSSSGPAKRVVSHLNSPRSPFPSPPALNFKT